MDSGRHCGKMGWVMNMDVSRQCALVLLMKLCQKLQGEEGKIMENGRSLCMKQSINTHSTYVEKKRLFYVTECTFLLQCENQLVNPN